MSEYRIEVTGHMTVEADSIEEAQEKAEPLTKETKLELRGNKGIWHIFLPGRRRKCLCGHKKKGSLDKRNTPVKKRKVQDILENPGKGLIGKISKHGLNSLKTRGNN